MQIAIHNASMDIVDYMNNDLPDALHYYSDTFSSYLKEGASTLNLSIHKFKDGKLNPRIQHITDRSYLSFRYMGDDYQFMISEIVETDYEIQLTCETLNLDLLNEYVYSYESSEPMSLAKHAEAMQLFKKSQIEIGVNECADLERTVSFDGEDTVLKRILELVRKFDGEVEFKSTLHDDGTLNQLILNIYRERDEEHLERGVGKHRTDVRLYFGREVRGITRTIDKTELYNAIRLKDPETGEYFTFTKERSIKNDDGKNEIIVRRRSNTIYAPISMRLYPSVTKRHSCDIWIMREKEVEYKTEDGAWSYAVRELKKHMYPKIEYDIEMVDELVIDAHNIAIGDTIYIHDDNFIDGLLLRARVIEKHVSFTNPHHNRIKLSNVQQIRSEISTSIVEQMNQMVRQAAPYTLRLSTSNGVIFKETTESSTITPTLMQNGDYAVGEAFVWFVNGVYSYMGDEFRMTPKLFFDETGVVACEAMVNGQMVAREELTFTNVYDGVSPILCVVDSSAGNIFKNGVIQTTLTARLWRGETEIDMDGSAFIYQWTKYRENGTIDEEWTEKYVDSMKSIIVTGDDVYRKGIFKCDIQPRYI